MNVKTKFLGEIQIEEKDIITFEAGIPGFQDLKRYVVLPLEADAFLYCMQSLEEAQVCFIIMPPASIVPDYDIEITSDTVEALDVKDPEEILLYAILTVPEDFRNMTANLKAPIVINTTNNKGVQELLADEAYGIRHRLFGEE